jgi:hypothetical protein
MFDLLLVVFVIVLFIFIWGFVAGDVLPDFLTPAIASVQGTPAQESTEFFLRMYAWAPLIIFVLGAAAWGVFGR